MQNSVWKAQVRVPTLSSPTLEVSFGLFLPCFAQVQTQRYSGTKEQSLWVGPEGWPGTGGQVGTSEHSGRSLALSQVLKAGDRQS